MLRIRGTVLPEREERTFWIDGGRLWSVPPSRAGATDCEVAVDGGWLLPGLVDVHTHPGAEAPGSPFDQTLLRRQLTEHRDAGVLAVRTPGTAARMPDWVTEDTELPQVRSAGRWLATPGRFFPGFGRDVSEADLVQAAVEEAGASSGWCKVIGDWKADERAVPLERMVAVVAAVHAIGGKVAVHCQTAEGSRNAVLAGADSLEHGMHLAPELLDRMAAQGTAFVPTLTTFASSAPAQQAREPGIRRDLWLAGWDALPGTVRAAHEAGVTVLAGTDSLPCGTVAGEATLLARAGLSAESALGAASWTARRWLGLPGLEDGAPADVIAYETDPTTEVDALPHPSRIILRGRVFR